jgi:hypothetical protein
VCVCVYESTWLCVWVPGRVCVCICMDACSLSYPACKAYTPYFDVIFSSSGSNTFFDIILLTAQFIKKASTLDVLISQYNFNILGYQLTDRTPSRRRELFENLTLSHVFNNFIAVTQTCSLSDVLKNPTILKQICRVHKNFTHFL